MNPNIRFTHTTLQVLQVLLENIRHGVYGSQISKETKFQSGTLYPILHRLEDCGWVEVEMEKADPKTLRRPLRKYYKLRGEAVPIAQEALSKRGIEGVNIPEWSGGHA